MQPERICKTIRQYNKMPVPDDDMRRLLELAQDYGKVKNYVYQRYGGINSLSKLYPGYTVQNEMTKSGLRAQLGLPSVYFYCAVHEALGDIKTQWTKVKRALLASINANERFTPEDRHYLRFVIKVSGCFENILTGREKSVPENMQAAYEMIAGGASGVCTASLDRYLCRQVRKKLCKLHTDKTEGFAVTERAYRYGEDGKNHGIFLSTKESRKRVFIPLTDGNTYTRQLYIKLKPKEQGVEIVAPIACKVKRRRDYTNEIGLSVGMWHMLTTDSGNVYGERFGELHGELVEYTRAADRTYRREKDNNAGRKKYYAHKAKLGARLESYVNQELNRMIAEEKPRIVYVPKLPSGSTAGHDRRINHSVTLWKKGYVRERLRQKCRENAIELAEVLGRGISTQCSSCGGEGSYAGEIFRCADCGCEEDKKVNAARNAISRGRSGQRLGDAYVPEG